MSLLLLRAKIVFILDMVVTIQTFPPQLQIKIEKQRIINKIIITWEILSEYMVLTKE